MSYVDLNFYELTPNLVAQLHHPRWKDLYQEILKKYYEEEKKDYYLRLEIAKNPNTTEKILEELAYCGDIFIKFQIIQNKSISEKIKNDLKYESIIFNESKNKDYTKFIETYNKFSDDFIKTLANDINIIIKKAICKNPNVKNSILEEIFEIYKNDGTKEYNTNNNYKWAVIQSLVANSNIEYSLIEKIYNSITKVNYSSGLVLAEIGKNPKTNPELLEIIYNRIKEMGLYDNYKDLIISNIENNLNFKDNKNSTTVVVASESEDDFINIKNNYDEIINNPIVFNFSTDEIKIIQYNINNNHTKFLDKYDNFSNLEGLPYSSLQHSNLNELYEKINENSENVFMINSLKYLANKGKELITQLYNYYSDTKKHTHLEKIRIIHLLDIKNNLKTDTKDRISFDDFKENIGYLSNILNLNNIPFKTEFNGIEFIIDSAKNKNDDFLSENISKKQTEKNSENIESNILNNNNSGDKTMVLNLKQFKAELNKEIAEKTGKTGLLNKIAITVFQGIARNIEQYNEILSVDKYKLAFIGTIGSGKTTSISHLFDLTYNENGLPKEIFKIASGRTTVCETEIKSGNKTKITIEPEDYETVLDYIETFLNETGVDSRLIQADDNFERLSAEIKRNIKNSLDFKDEYIRDKNRKITATIHPEIELYKEEYNKLKSQIIQFNDFKIKYEKYFNKLIELIINQKNDVEYDEDDEFDEFDNNEINDNVVKELPPEIFEDEEFKKFNISKDKFYEDFKKIFEAEFNEFIFDFIKNNKTVFEDLTDYIHIDEDESFEEKIKKIFFERYNDGNRIKTELVYNGNNERDEEFKWIKKYTHEINDGENKEVPFPKKIIVEINKNWVSNLDKFKNVTDTKGLEQPNEQKKGNQITIISREDIDEIIKTEDTLCVFTSSFNNAPETNITNIISKAFVNETQNNNLKFIILVLPYDGEPENVNGNPDREYDWGTEKKREEILNALDTYGIKNFKKENIIFFSSLKYFLLDNGKIASWKRLEDEEYNAKTLTALQKEEITNKILETAKNRELFYENKVEEEKKLFEKHKGKNIQLTHIEQQLISEMLVQINNNSNLRINIGQNGYDFVENFINWYSPLHFSSKKAISKRNGDSYKSSKGDLSFYGSASEIINKYSATKTENNKETVFECIKEMAEELKKRNTTNCNTINEFIPQLIKEEIQWQYEAFIKNIGDSLEQKLKDELDDNFWGRMRAIRGIGYNTNISKELIDKLNQKTINIFLQKTINEEWKIFINYIINLFTVQ